jgi:hypothetical protein
MELRNFIKNTIREYLNETYIIKVKIREFLNESVNKELNINLNYINELKNELSNFKTDEELLRNGGISIETLDRLAYGFSEEDVKILAPEQLKIKWKTDLENVKYEIQQSGLTPKQWASKINLSKPIDVSYWEDDKHKRGFYVEDGHHRYTAAKILKKPLNVNLEIKVNPIKVISPNMGYDDFHRYIFKLYKTNELINDSIKVYHGTKSYFVNSIKENGLIDKTGYNQGWYMVSTDFESALFHAHPDNDNDDVYVIEFKIPNHDNDRWDGFPYLWKGQKMKDNSIWFALMRQIPNDFITKIHKVDYNKWYNQKIKGFNI